MHAYKIANFVELGIRAPKGKEKKICKVKDVTLLIRYVHQWSVKNLIRNWLNVQVSVRKTIYRKENKDKQVPGRTENCKINNKFPDKNHGVRKNKFNE